MVDIDKRESSRNRSLERALSLLSILEETGRSLTLTEISAKAQLQKPTAQRLLAVLERYGYAEKLHNRYLLGPIVLPLAYSYLMSNELSALPCPFCRSWPRLPRRRLRCAHWQLPRGCSARRRHTSLRYVLPIGRRLPLHMGVGKVLAPAMPEEELASLVASLGEVRYANGECIGS